MTDSILIVGGGIAGLTAALECANAGARAIVVERQAIVGGKAAAALTAKSSVGDRMNGVPIPKLDALREARNVELLTLTDVRSFAGRPGNFDVQLRERARFVSDACTLCNHCRPVCPVVRPNAYDAGLSYRKAIYLPQPDGLPPEFVIDIDACLNAPPNYLPCNRCTEVCDDDAIHFDVPLEQLAQRQVGAAILAVGFEHRSGPAERGYGTHPDIVTTAELERLLTAPGPTGGFAARPSNEDYPSSMLFVLDDLGSYAIHTVTRQMHRLIDQDVGRLALLVTHQPDDAERAALQESLPQGLTVNCGLLQKVEARGDSRLTVTFADLLSSRIPEDQFDMVVLHAGIRPVGGLADLASVFGCELSGEGFVARSDAESRCATSAPGVYVAGGAGGPATLADTVAQAKTAATAALGHLDPRLLTLGEESAKPAAADTEATDQTQAAVQARLERALHALLDSAK